MKNVGEKMRHLFFLLFCAFPQVANAQLKIEEQSVPANSFAEASVTLPENSVATFIILPSPKKVVELSDRVLFNGDPGLYSVSVVISTIENGKVTAKKYTENVTLGRGPPPKNAFQAAYDEELASDKAASVKALAALYGEAANDPPGKTYGQLYQNMMEASRKMLPATAVPKVRAEIGKLLNPLFSDPNAAVDKAKVSAEFKSIASVLSSLK